MKKFISFTLLATKAFTMAIIPSGTSSPSMPPCRVQGTVTLDGFSAVDGTVINALIDGTQVAQGVVLNGKFKVQFDAANYLGKTIGFAVGTTPANEKATTTYGLVKLNLTASSKRS